TKFRERLENGNAMQRSFSRMAKLVFDFTALALWITGSSLFAASAATSVLKAKQEAEAQGYVFPATHEEIVLEAKKEGKLRVLTSLQPKTFKAMAASRSEEHTSELQSRVDLVCRLLLEKKNNKISRRNPTHT